MVEISGAFAESAKSLTRKVVKDFRDSSLKTIVMCLLWPSSFIYMVHIVFCLSNTLATDYKN